MAPFWEDPAWQHHQDLMKRHQDASQQPGTRVVTADERPACSPLLLEHEGTRVTVTLAVPGLGALVLSLGEGTKSGRLDWRGCRLTTR